MFFWTKAWYVLRVQKTLKPWGYLSFLAGWIMAGMIQTGSKVADSALLSSVSMKQLRTNLALQLQSKHASLLNYLVCLFLVLRCSVLLILLWSTVPFKLHMNNKWLHWIPFFCQDFTILPSYFIIYTLENTCSHMFISFVFAAGT